MKEFTPKPKEKKHLAFWIFLAIVLAFVLAWFVPQWGIHLEVGGEIFLRLLKMVVVPLVVASVMSGILGMGDVRKLGRPGGLTILYFLATTLMAVVIGLVLVNVFRPGEGFDLQSAEQNLSNVERIVEAGKDSNAGTIIKNLVLTLFTDNILKSALDAELLPLILFSVVFAGLLTTMGRRTENIRAIIVEVNDALLTFVVMLMKLAPLGIFCLVATRFSKAQLQGDFAALLARLAWFMGTVLGGLAIHGLVLLPFLYWFFRRRNPYKFLAQISQALLTAFSTASSSATLPVTMENTVDRAGVSKKAVDFVLPIGSTVNMNGTALYEAAAALFIAQAVGHPLTMTDQVVIALTATLAAIGAAGIPEAGLVTMVIVLKAVNLPMEYMALIIPVDWILDRFRTVVNVQGDAIGAAIVEPAFGDEK